ncbi:MAG: hypothetical protein ACOYYJ_07495 [Chloroflexota bacterium]
MQKTIRLLPLLVLLLTSCVMRVSTPSAGSVTTLCKLNLRLYVRQGENIGSPAAGQVDFGSADGSFFEGSLVEMGGASHPISLSFDGREMSFILTLDQGQVYGTGVMDHLRSDCDGQSGGTFSGPALGDLGDWRGEWVRETIVAAQPAQPTVAQPAVQDTSYPQPWLSIFSSLCIILPFAAIGLGFFLSSVGRSRILSAVRKSQAKRNVLSKSVRKKTPPAGEQPDDGGAGPLAEYLVTYTPQDKHFDLSFEVEDRGGYRGECGIQVARTLGAASSATALEFWLFSTHSIQTATQVLMSEYCYRDASLRQELERKGQAVQFQPGAVVTLETDDLTARATVTRLEYADDTPEPNSVFKQVSIQIGVWKRAGGF